MKRTLILAGLMLAMVAKAQVDPTVMTRINKQAQEIEPRMIEWRRFLHQNPELSNREFKTGKYLADFLKNLGM
jgi:amidohydrolase